MSSAVANWPDIDIEEMSYITRQRRSTEFLEEQILARTTFVRKGRGGPEQRIRYRMQIGKMKKLLEDR